MQKDKICASTLKIVRMAVFFREMIIWRKMVFGFKDGG
jgi:hypothetical protein